MSIHYCCFMLFSSLVALSKVAAFVPKRSRCASRVSFRQGCFAPTRFMSTNSDDDSENAGSNNIKQNKQHTIRWKSLSGKDDIIFEAEDGELLRTAALRRGLVSPHNGRARLINCRGLGTCGTCAVEIEGTSPDEESICAPVDPPERNSVENLRLSFPPHGSSNQSPKLRLACQVAVRGDLLITKRAGFWGQDDTEMVDPSSAKTYFGELEYVLDRRSSDKDV